MKTTVVIKVTKEDIQNGSPRNGYACAISKACKRLFPGSLTFTQLTYIQLNDKKFKPKNNKDAVKLKKFINNFDDYGGSHKYCRPTTINLVSE